MSDLGKGNFTDNGVHEQGTDETRIAYQNDTPGQAVDQYIKERNKAYHKEAKETKKKHFSQVFGNPLKNFPYNEEFEVSLKEELELSESKIVLTKVMFDALSKMGVDKLMKKHDAYINKKESDKEYTTISTPSAGFGGELSKLIKKNKSKLRKLVPEEVELDENIQKIVKMFPRDNNWKKLVMKHRRSIEDFRKGKDLKGSAESDLINWAMNNGEIRSDDADEVDDFLQQILDEDSNMAINPKTVNKTKPMLMKYAKKFGVDLEFGYKGRMPSLLQIKSKSSQAEKGFLDAVGKDKKLMKLLDHVEHDAEDLEENADKSLRKKAEKTGIPFGILKKVYNRGVAAWKTGHRPGTTPEQWGHARVNSFATKSKGTWGGADKDLAKQVG